MPKPIWLLILAATIAGLAVARRPEPTPADLSVWIFSADHVRLLSNPYVDALGRTQPSLLEQYRARTGKSVSLTLMGGRSLDLRLLSLLNHPPSSGRQLLPDVVEIEIGSVGMYLRANADRMPLMRLDRYVDAAGLRSRVAPQRLAIWSRDGSVFALPLDAHPVALAYRQDLFAQAGVDLETPQTWPDLQAACQRFDRYWHNHGAPQRLAMALHRSNADALQMMLQQRRVNPIEADGRVRLDDPIVAATLAFYTTLVAGSDASDPPIADDPTPGPARWTADLADGERCAAFLPDWSINDLRAHPDLAGKLRLRPLPRFDPADAPTATWGGTSAAIPAGVADPDAAWDLLQFLFFSPQANAARAATNDDILSAIPDEWPGGSAYIHVANSDAFFGPQDPRVVMADLARQMPQRVVTSFTLLGGIELSRVLTDAVAARRAGADRATLERRAADWLRDASADLRRQIAFEKLAP
jgi:arabinosaccharide transport system substrate-binding protein